VGHGRVVLALVVSSLGQLLGLRRLDLEGLEKVSVVAGSDGLLVVRSLLRRIDSSLRRTLLGMMDAVVGRMNSVAVASAVCIGFASVRCTGGTERSSLMSG